MPLPTDDTTPRLRDVSSHVASFQIHRAKLPSAVPKKGTGTRGCRSFSREAHLAVMVTAPQASCLGSRPGRPHVRLYARHHRRIGSGNWMSLRQRHKATLTDRAAGPVGRTTRVYCRGAIFIRRRGRFTDEQTLCQANRRDRVRQQRATSFSWTSGRSRQSPITLSY